MGPDGHYRGQRLEISELFAGLTAEQLALTVPGCPEWTVRDLLGHVVGVVADVRAGHLAGAASEAWTQAQVDARRELSVREALDEWAQTAPAFEDGLPGMGFMGWVMVWDITMHGDDLREALGLPLGTSGTHAVVLDGLVEAAGQRAKGIGTLRLAAGARAWQVGEGEPVASVTAPDEGELARAVGGRRTDAQVLGLDWSGDPTPWLDALPLFRHGW